MSPLTPLLRPGRYFAERETNFFRVVAVLALLALAGPATVYGLGWVTTAHVDGTVTVENSERPPEFICERGEDPTLYDAGDCQEPREVERDVDTVLWDAFSRFAGPSLLAVPLVVVVAFLFLHVGVWLADGSRGVFRTFSVTTLGMLPALVLTPLSIAVFAWMLHPITIPPDRDAIVIIEQFRMQAVSATSLSGPLRFASALWSGVIWRFGLVHNHELTGTQSTLIAGYVAVCLGAVGLL
jgi:hypothetical protein